MGTELSDIDRALLVFRNRVENLLIGEGARLLPDGAFLLDTPVGPLRAAISGNWIISDFASPLGGNWATDGQADRVTGRWRYYVANSVEALTHPHVLEDFASDLERFWRSSRPTANVCRSSKTFATNADTSSE